jgi:2'-5' RNA ligase
MEERPIIITLKLNAEAQEFFDTLRQQHFPANRNYLKAHLTLFHHLPPTHIPEIKNVLDQIATNTSAFSLEVQPPKSIGRGVAYPMQSAKLASLHKQMQHTWKKHLTPQDANKLWPHITVQNKVARQQAKELQEKLLTEPFPNTVNAEGFSLFYYDSGPWEWIGDIVFIGKS